MMRARLLMEDAQESFLPLTRLGRRFEYMFPMSDPPNYEPDPETSIAAQAARRGVEPAELAYDLMMENGGRNLLLLALANYGNGNLDPILSLMTDPNCVLGLGDGGAHYGMICDSSFPTTVLQHWTRERDGQRISIERAVQALTSDPAQTVGLNDRGILSVGRKADLNVIDHGRVQLHTPQVRYDLPAGGRRLYQDAAGYEATIVSGVVTSREGRHTGALPGRLVRGSQLAPA
jgi:N-acyl-D-aspartate/D-glutamate deacylase